MRGETRRGTSTRGTQTQTCYSSTVGIWTFSYLEVTNCALEPAGVGYSYNDGPTIDNSFIAGEDMWALLQLFYKRFGQYSNELHVAGESYGGTYVPHIASAIHKNNKALSENSHARDDLVHVNLTSILIGNGGLLHVLVDALFDLSCRLDRSLLSNGCDARVVLQQQMEGLGKGWTRVPRIGEKSSGLPKVDQGSW
jgi:hypothetical protein